ncbi:MAG TPA: hypothetical protein PKY05_17505, partial [Fibrobacteria bacterium]|nr:hypothetical protein [Fibrobacteria bacterium]
GYIGVKKDGTTNTIVMVNAGNTTPTQVATAPLSGNRVFLRIDMNFQNRTDKATFFYSTDSVKWTQLGNTLQMSYELTHFTGYRFGLFNYATKSAGGYADFDWFKIGATVNDNIELSGTSPEAQVPLPGRLLTYRWDRARSSVSLRYTVQEAGKIGFRLVDLEGRLIASTPARSLETGDHLLDMRVPGLARGTYVLQGLRDGTTWGSWPISLSR